MGLFFVQKASIQMLAAKKEKNKKPK